MGDEEGGMEASSEIKKESKSERERSCEVPHTTQCGNLSTSSKRHMLAREMTRKHRDAGPTARLWGTRSYITSLVCA